MNIRMILGTAMGAAAIVAGCSAAVPDEPAPTDPVEGDQADLKNKIFCGGFANLPCPEGYVCVDDPSDGCNPNNGGADCGGYCKHARKPPSKCHDPNKTYVSTDPNECAVIKFYCAEGTPFFDQCGCGCEVPPGPGTQCGTKVCGPTQTCCSGMPFPEPTCINGDICPISRAKYKTEIDYLTDSDVKKLHDEILAMPLASYRYKTEEPGARRHLGFIIDDVGASQAVDSSGERVDLYGYTSMAVAALKVQARQIAELKREVAELRSSSSACGAVR